MAPLGWFLRCYRLQSRLLYSGLVAQHTPHNLWMEETCRRLLQIHHLQESAIDHRVIVRSLVNALDISVDEVGSWRFGPYRLRITEVLACRQLPANIHDLGRFFEKGARQLAGRRLCR